MAEREDRAFTLVERALTLADRARTVSSRFELVDAPDPPGDDGDHDAGARGADAQIRKP